MPLAPYTTIPVAVSASSTGSIVSVKKVFAGLNI